VQSFFPSAVVGAGGGPVARCQAACAGGLLDYGPCVPGVASLEPSCRCCGTQYVPPCQLPGTYTCPNGQTVVLDRDRCELPPCPSACTNLAPTLPCPGPNPAGLASTLDPVTCKYSPPPGGCPPISSREFCRDLNSRQTDGNVVGYKGGWTPSDFCHVWEFGSGPATLKISFDLGAEVPDTIKVFYPPGQRSGGPLSSIGTGGVACAGGAAFCQAVNGKLPGDLLIDWNPGPGQPTQVEICLSANIDRSEVETEWQYFVDCRRNFQPPTPQVVPKACPGPSAPAEASCGSKVLRAYRSLPRAQRAFGSPPARVDPAAAPGGSALWARCASRSQCRAAGGSEYGSCGGGTASDCRCCGPRKPPRPPSPPRQYAQCPAGQPSGQCQHQAAVAFPSFAGSLDASSGSVPAPGGGGFQPFARCSGGMTCRELASSQWGWTPQQINDHLAYGQCGGGTAGGCQCCLPKKQPGYNACQSEAHCNDHCKAPVCAFPAACPFDGLTSPRCESTQCSCCMRKMMKSNKCLSDAAEICHRCGLCSQSGGLTQLQQGAACFKCGGPAFPDADRCASCVRDVLRGRKRSQGCASVGSNGYDCCKQQCGPGEEGQRLYESCENFRFEKAQGGAIDPCGQSAPFMPSSSGQCSRRTPPRLQQQQDEPPDEGSSSSRVAPYCFLYTAADLQAETVPEECLEEVTRRTQPETDCGAFTAADLQAETVPEECLEEVTRRTQPETDCGAFTAADLQAETVPEECLEEVVQRAQQEAPLARPSVAQQLARRRDLVDGLRGGSSPQPSLGSVLGEGLREAAPALLGALPGAAVGGTLGLLGLLGVIRDRGGEEEDD